MNRHFFARKEETQESDKIYSKKFGPNSVQIFNSLPALCVHKHGAYAKQRREPDVILQLVCFQSFKDTSVKTRVINALLPRK